MNQVQRGIFPLVIIPCGIILFVLHKIGKLRLNGETRWGERVDWITGAASGALFGQFIFHAWPTVSSDIAIVPLCVFGGFFGMICFQKLERLVKHKSELLSVELYDIIDNDTIQEKAVYSPDSLADEHIPEEIVRVGMQNGELWRRRCITWILIVTLSLLALAEGVYFCFHAADDNGTPLGAKIALYWINKCVETYVVGSAMLFSVFHGREERKRSWFGPVSLVWCVAVVTGSTLFAAAGLTWDQAVQVVMHPATTVVYGVCAGIIGWTAMYFCFIDVRRTTWKKTLVRLGLFGGMAGISCVTGVFL